MRHEIDSRPDSGSDFVLRWVILGVALALIVSGGLPLLSRVFADTPEVVQVRLDASNIQPRPLEQLTGQAIVKKYSQAWKDMETALAENRPGVLDESFVRSE